MVKRETRPVAPPRSFARRGGGGVGPRLAGPTTVSLQQHVQSLSGARVTPGHPDSNGKRFNLQTQPRYNTGQQMQGIPPVTGAAAIPKTVTSQPTQSVAGATSKVPCDPAKAQAFFDSIVKKKKEEMREEYERQMKKDVAQHESSMAQLLADYERVAAEQAKRELDEELHVERQKIQSTQEAIRSRILQVKQEPGEPTDRTPDNEATRRSARDHPSSKASAAVDQSRQVAEHSIATTETCDTVASAGDDAGSSDLAGISVLGVPGISAQDIVNHPSFRSLIMDISTKKNIPPPLHVSDPMSPSRQLHIKTEQPALDVGSLPTTPRSIVKPGAKCIPDSEMDQYMTKKKKAKPGSSLMGSPKTTLPSPRSQGHVLKAKAQEKKAQMYKADAILQVKILLH